MHTTPLSPPIGVVLGDGSSIQASAETAEPTKGDDLPETALITPRSVSRATIDTCDHRFGHLNADGIFDERGTNNDAFERLIIYTNDAAPPPVNLTSPSPSIKGHQLNVPRSDDGGEYTSGEADSFLKDKGCHTLTGGTSLGCPSSMDLFYSPAPRPSAPPACMPTMRPSGRDDS